MIATIILTLSVFFVGTAYATYTVTVNNQSSNDIVVFVDKSDTHCVNNQDQFDNQLLYAIIKTHENHILSHSVDWDGLSCQLSLIVKNASSKEVIGTQTFYSTDKDSTDRYWTIYD